MAGVEVGLQRTAPVFVNHLKARGTQESSDLIGLPPTLVPMPIPTVIKPLASVKFTGSFSTYPHRFRSLTPFGRKRDRFPSAVGGDSNDRFIEAGVVSVSQDGINFFRFEPSIDSSRALGDSARYRNVAGVEPALPGDGPDCIGGDRFDLATVGLPSTRFVRIEDPAATLDDPGNQTPCSNNCGFDLDAVGILHHAPVP